MVERLIGSNVLDVEKKDGKYVVTGNDCAYFATKLETNNKRREVENDRRKKTSSGPALVPTLPITYLDKANPDAGFSIIEKDLLPSDTFFADLKRQLEGVKATIQK